MTDIERIWRDKTDDDLIVAAAQLSDYTSEGQRVIRSELKRRGLEDPVEQRGAEAEEPEEEPSLDCLRCNVELKFLGTKEFHEGARWGLLGELGHLFEHSEAFEVYACPSCGHVEFFVRMTDAGAEP